jgi:NAD(P)-dependent dehydrogenase (short-subunit alcohol dehydrogenase family)
LPTQVNVRGTAIVTGAAGGIGRAFVSKLLEAGASVAMVDIAEERLRDLAASLPADHEAQSYVLDQSDVSAIDAVFDAIERDLGRIRVLVNNAGVSNMQDALSFTEAEYDRLANVNQKGPFFCALAAGRRMIEHGDGGRIVNIASAAAVRVIDGNCPYGMTKAALMFMTQALAKEWGPHGVNSNCICPGYIDTPMNDHIWKTEHGQRILSLLPKGRLGTPEDLSQMMVFLASEQAHFVNGAVISVDDGLQHAFPF